MKVFVFDVEKCNGCLNCQFACKDEHCGNDWSPYTLPQPDTGCFWAEIEARERGQVPKVTVSHILHICQHCDNAPCMAAAPDAVYKRENGLVVIDPERSRGRRDLVESCPYGAITFNEEADVPQKCTGCAHLIDDGWSAPRCVDACGLGALRFGDEVDFADEIALADTMLPECGTQPRVYYLNMPKRFVGGVVVDVDADEVVIGAKVTLENPASGGILQVETDDFGDFWFKQIEAADYNLYFEAEGYLTRMVEVSTLEEDKNVGVIELFAQPTTA